MTTIDKIGGKRLSPSDRRILRVLVNAGWRIHGQRSHPLPWRYEMYPPPDTGGAPQSLNTGDVLRLVKRGLLEVERLVTEDDHWLKDSLAGRRALRTGLLEPPLEQESFLDPPKPRGRNAMDR